MRFPFVNHVLLFVFCAVFGSAIGDKAVNATFQEEQIPSVRQFDENRRTVNAELYPFSAIGRLNAAGIDRRSHCTAVLISDKHVLTAAHCIYFSARRRWFLPSEINFLPGYQRGEFIAHGRIESIAAKGPYDPFVKRSERKTGSDWAILTLKEPLPIEPLPVLELDSRVKNGKLFQSGYHRQRPHVQTLNSGCKIIENTASMFFHNCMLGPGDSGSPVLYEKDDRFFVVGLNTSSVRLQKGRPSGGLAISSAVIARAISQQDSN